MDALIFIAGLLGVGVGVARYISRRITREVDLQIKAKLRGPSR